MEQFSLMLIFFELLSNIPRTRCALNLSALDDKTQVRLNGPAISSTQWTGVRSKWSGPGRFRAHTSNWVVMRSLGPQNQMFKLVFSDKNGDYRSQSFFIVRIKSAVEDENSFLKHSFHYKSNWFCFYLHPKDYNLRNLSIFPG